MDATEERSPKRARKEEAPEGSGEGCVGGEPPRVPWLLGERTALRQAFIMFGVGRWKEIHLAFCRLNKCKHVRTAGEVERAVWHLLQALRSHTSDPGDAALLDQLLQPVAQAGDLTTAGAPWPKVDKGSRWLMGRLRNLSDFNSALRSLQQQPQVQARVRQLLAAMTDRSPPATWWNHDCDMALLYGMHRAGYGEYDAVFADPEFLPVFQGAREAHYARLRELTSGAAAAAGGAAAGCEAAEAQDKLAAAAAVVAAAASAAAADVRNSQPMADGSKGAGEEGEAAAPTTAAAEGDAATAAAAKPDGAAAAATSAAPPSYVWPDGQALTPRIRRLCDLVLKAVRQVEEGV
ncbi:hypothetical protein Agub_g14659, partial [Astrephomene gubernaculifera]